MQRNKKLWEIRIKTENTKNKKTEKNTNKSRDFSVPRDKINYLK